ncbi:MAG: hypothetical protein MI700_01450 [Balneolales bacterium]|nr:hypothetical protein [Balneolales bacterium]
MILKESEIDKDNIEPVLGNPYREPGKLLTVTGSSFYFIKKLTTKTGENVLMWEDSKGIFQRYENGLALFVNRSNYQRVYLIPFSSIKKITLTIIEQHNSGTFLTGLASIFSLIGFKNLFVYAKRDTALEFETNDYKGYLITNFSSFKSQKKYFKNLGLGTTLQVIEPLSQPEL